MRFHKAKAKVDLSERSRTQSGPQNNQGGQATRALAGVLLMAVAVILPIGAVSAVASAAKEPLDPPLAAARAHSAPTVKSRPWVSAWWPDFTKAKPKSKAHVVAVTPPPADPGRDFLKVLAVIHDDPYLSCVRGRESGGEYGINTGNGYYGAYQFAPGTWVSAALHAGLPGLASQVASAAAPPDQDLVAWVLYQWQGRAPWAGGRYTC